MGQQIRKVTNDDVPELSGVLARAFFDDPVAMHLIPSARRRPGGLRSFFRIQLRKDLIPFGGVYTTEDLAGAAMWAPPGKPAPSPIGMLLSVLPVAPYVLGRHFGRTIRSLAQVEAIHPKEPHWYLATLGTEPTRQGEGIGSALLRPVLERCDEDGARAYLESSKESNVPFYRRHGFEVTGKVRLGGGPDIWLMWRDPAPSASGW